MSPALPWEGPVTLALAWGFDRVLGEYPSEVHPVVAMGKVIEGCIRVAPRKGRGGPFLWGLFMALFVPSLFAGAAWVSLRWLAPWPWVRCLWGAFLLKASFAVRELGTAACRVASALEVSRLSEARVGLRHLCSRDPSNLGEEDLAAAAIESVAENASDSFVAPLFYFLLAGVPGALAYRAINTLDSMVGYHGRFEYLGKAAARLDDVVNWVPARLTALLLLLGGRFRRGDVKRGWATLLRDGGRTESPNAGRPMAVMAGLLRVRLEKGGHYALGDAIESVSAFKIHKAWAIVALAARMAFGLGFLILIWRSHAVLFRR